MKYKRKKLPTLEAVQWFGGNEEEVSRFLSDLGVLKNIEFLEVNCYFLRDGVLTLHLKNCAKQVVPCGAYIYKDECGRIQICSPALFESMYEPVVNNSIASPNIKEVKSSNKVVQLCEYIGAKYISRDSHSNSIHLWGREPIKTQERKVLDSGVESCETTFIGDETVALFPAKGLFDWVKEGKCYCIDV